MRILFDQGAPVPIAAWLRDHTTRTTLEEGWDTLVNGELLRVAEEAGFDVLLTTDNNMAYQQKLKGRKLAIVVLSRNRWRLVQRVIRKIVTAINKAEPGSYAVIGEARHRGSGGSMKTGRRLKDSAVQTMTLQQARKWARSEAGEKDLERVAAVAETPVDTNDIPEVVALDGWQRNPLCRPATQSVTG